MIICSHDKFFSGAGYNFPKRESVGSFQLQASMANLSILHILPHTLWWIPLFQELSSSNSLTSIWNKVSFLTWLLSSSHMEAHASPLNAPCTPPPSAVPSPESEPSHHCNQTVQIHPSPHSSDATSCRKPFLISQFLVNGPFYVLCRVHFFHHNIYHLYLFSNWIMNSLMSGF